MNLPEWAKWVARDADGQLYAYEYKPYKEVQLGEWLKEDGDNEVNGEHIKILTDSFDHIEWSDTEPTELSAIPNNPIQPPHYRKGEIDLYESWYRTRPFAEFRAIMESIAERYMKRDKLNRLEDLDKAIYTLQRLREYEEKEVANQ